MNVHSTFICCPKVDFSNATGRAWSVGSAEIEKNNSTTINEDTMPNLLGYVFMSKKGIFGHCELCQSEGTNELFNYRWS